MRRTYLSLTVVAGLLLTLGYVLSPARADQTDPRLDALFKQLKQSPDPVHAQRIESLIWAIWQHSDNPAIETLMVKGIAAMNRQHYQIALHDFDQIVQRAPDFAEGWNKRATVYYLLGEYDRSLHDIKRTLALEPRHFGALAGMGLVFMAQGDDLAALQAFQAVLKINPQATDIRNQVKRLRQQLRNEVI